MVAWINNDKETGWVQIEQSTVRGVFLSTLPFLSFKSVSRIKNVGEFVQHTLRVWTTVRKKLGGPMSISRALPIVGNIASLVSLLFV